MLVVLAITFLSPNIYRSEASLLVKLGRESVTIDPTAAIGQISNVSQDRSNEINSELQILRSRDLFETVVSRLGVETFQNDHATSDPTRNSAIEESLGWIKGIKSVLKARLMTLLKIDPEPEKVRKQIEREKIIGQLMEHLGAQVESKSNVITLSYESKSPEMAHAVLREIIAAYLDKHMAIHRTGGSYQFFEQQSEKVKKNIEDAGKSLNEIKNQTGIASFEKQGTLLLGRIDFLKRNLQETEASLAANEKQVEALKRNLADMPKTTVQSKITGRPDDAIEGLRKKIFDLKLEEQRVLSKYADAEHSRERHPTRDKGRGSAAGKGGRLSGNYHGKKCHLPAARIKCVR